MTVPPKPKGVVLASGGMDSLVLAAFATRESDIALLHVNYGQPTEQKELACFYKIAESLKVKELLVADIGYLKAIGGSALTDPSIAIPSADMRRQGVPVTYVPFRNAHFLCIAVSWAEVIGAKSVYIGAVMADSSGYPDCRPEFYDAMNEAVRRGTKEESGIAIRAPFVHLRKKDLILMGKSMEVPFEHSWSCYRGGEKACGRCDSCALRLRAFAEAGVPDPILYEARPEY
ncbi:MAG: 7-cyano-7-deazaguanine synthase QueC [Deltaproteobacteria bacterium]|nr:7-cyano-7-deazaguanine synthase QueC [Deltaproteobacteria bacterium]